MERIRKLETPRQAFDFAREHEIYVDAEWHKNDGKYKIKKVNLEPSHLLKRYTDSLLDGLSSSCKIHTTSKPAGGTA